LKKLGKKVQTEKRLEKEKTKSDALDKIQTRNESTFFSLSWKNYLDPKYWNSSCDPWTGSKLFLCSLSF